MRAAIIAGTRSKNNHILNLQDNNNNNNNNTHDPHNSTATPSAANSSLDASPTASRPRPQPPSANPPLRPPLRARDRNAMMRASTPKASTALVAKSGNANANNPNMPPYDHKPNVSRPLMPTLSASARVPHRPAITPRVAGSMPTPNPNTTTTPLPLSRRTPRAAGGGTGGGGDADTPTTTAASKEDLSTPVSAFLNTNITPRSGSRKNRVDSANTTPTGTPNGTSVIASAIELPRASHDGPGLGISGMDRDLPKRPTVSFNTATSEVGGYPKTSASSSTTTADLKFFFASDAKSAQPPKPALQSKAPSSFFYANGGSIPPPAQSSNSSAVGSSIGEERGQPKFFHANGTPDIQLSPSPYFAPPRPGSAASSSSRVTTARAPTSSPSALSPPQRPLSPSKLSQQASVASLRNTPPLPAPAVTSPQTSGRAHAPTNGSVAARKAGIEISPRAVSHRRSESTGSIGSSLRKFSDGSSVENGPPSTPLNVTTAGLDSTPEEAPDPDYKDGFPSGLPQSPIKSGQSIEQLNELAASARRERKVLDLEITNSSLEAINRTLEREMRKQTAELRRYRRLSRSGRLSIATTTSLRSSTGTLSSLGGNIEGNVLSDMSEEEEVSDMSDDETDSMDDGSLSPDAMAESDLRHFKKDEKRLQLDLSKHQQLLIDSQKMNQGLKRCLEWTEALIGEGKRALEYHVRVSDVELGGRVLTPDEVEDTGGNEGMSDIGARLLREARTTVVPWGAEGRDDRDSGIELDGAQRETVGSPPPLPQ